MRKDHMNIVCEIIVSILECETNDVKGDTIIGSLEKWDSLAHFSILMTFEKKLGRRMTTEEITSLETVESFVSILASADM